jgi:putative spermidine/putrescine transport system ATP-binding protein
MSGVQICNLYKSFGAHPVLAGLDLEVPAGSLTAILGPSGSGKTTLLRLLAGFERPDLGTISVAGKIVDGESVHIHPERRQIGYVPQEGGLFPHLTVQANVAFGLPRAARRRGVGELLEMVGLSGLERRYPHQLSGGQQQRVALARALITRPKVLLLDEPLSALDPFLRGAMREELKRLQRELGISFIHVTHSQEEALALADLVVVMDHGRIAQHGTPREIFDTPATAFIARFMGGHNVISNGHGAFAVRADRCRIAPLTANEGLSGAICSIEYLGAVVKVGLSTESGGEIVALLPDDQFFAAPLAMGETARLVWAPQDAHPVTA